MIVATFHGPNYDSPNHDEHTIEVFANIGHAISTLFDRYDANGRRHLPVRFLNGNHGAVLFPAVTEGHYLKCYLIEGDLPPEDQAIDEGVILEALSDVHLGVTDYVLTLMPPFGHETTGSVAVSVNRRR